MRELERDFPTPSAAARDAVLPALVVVGAGRVGCSIARRVAARRAGGGPRRPGGRRPPPVPQAEAVLLCVPDEAIGTAAGRSPPPRRGCATPATPAGSRSWRRWRRSPPPGPRPSRSTRCRRCRTGPPTSPAAQRAISGSDPAALALARTLAERLGMRPFEIPEERRAAYHAAASIASNFLVALRGVGGRAARRGGRSRTRASCSLRWCCARRRTGPSSVRGAHRADRTRRRGHRGPPPRGAARGGARADPRLRSARRAHPRARGDGRRDDAGRHQGRAASGARARPAGRSLDRSGADDGSPPWRPPGAAATPPATAASWWS